MLNSIPRLRYLAVLGTLLLVAIIVSSIHPRYPSDWLIENALVVAGLVLIAATYRRLPLSRISYTLIFIFLCLHEIGAHWTYAEVPYNDWWRSLFGVTFNEQFGLARNHFDRLVHFMYGFLIFYPVREFFLRVADAKGVWGYVLPLDVMMSTSMIYELIEWGAAVVFGGDLGAAYLGSQGDIWDAQKDMGMATIGAFLAMLITAAINARSKRDFARDLRDSLRVKQPLPMGEEELARRAALQ